MKKFFTLFALLSLTLSASADYFDPDVSGNFCVFYESGIQGVNFTKVYAYNSQGLVTSGWPGNDLVQEGTYNGKILYKATFTSKPDYVIFSGDGKQTVDLGFTNKGYYYVDKVISGGEQNGKYNVTNVYDVSTGFDIYFDKGNTNWEKYCLYAWHNEQEIIHRAAGWPGIEMVNLGNGIYKMHIIDEHFSKIIFNDGKYSDQGGIQTDQMSGEAGKIYYVSNQGINITVSGKITQGSTSYTASSASYERNCSTQWGTLCLPFEIKNVTEYTNVTFYNLNSVDAEAMHFAPITSGSIDAGSPLVFKLSSENGGLLRIEETNASCTVSTSTASADGGWTMKGTFQGTTKTGIYYIKNNLFWYGTGTITINPYRAWFEGPAPTKGAPLRIEVDDTEGLQFVEQENGSVKAYYDLQGRKLDSARKGLVIENGKIIMVK